jgi:hypothetical protein
LAYLGFVLSWVCLILLSSCLGFVLSLLCLVVCLFLPWVFLVLHFVLPCVSSCVLSWVRRVCLCCICLFFSLGFVLSGAAGSRASYDTVRTMPYLNAVLLEVHWFNCWCSFHWFTFSRFFVVCGRRFASILQYPAMESENLRCWLTLSYVLFVFGLLSWDRLVLHIGPIRNVDIQDHPEMREMLAHAIVCMHRYAVKDDVLPSGVPVIAGSSPSLALSPVSSSLVLSSLVWSSLI